MEWKRVAAEFSAIFGRRNDRWKSAGDTIAVPHMCLACPEPSSGGAYVQDKRYIAIEHMDVQRDRRWSGA